MGAASNRSLRPALIAAALLAAALFLTLLPARAYADSYECPRVDLTAQAQSDGSLHVVEQRMFDFSGEFSAVWWTFSGLPWNADVAINSMRVAAVDADGNLTGEWEDLPETPFQIGWRDSGGPNEAAWSFDEVRNTVYAFADFTDARLLIELDYTVENGVQAYDDIAEIYWKYIPEGWSVDARNVTLSIVLPVPSGTTVTPGDNVRAWGHGPLDGTVTVNEDGTVLYEVPLVRSGQYAEARVVFPVSWLSNLDAEAKRANQGTTRLDTVLAEEQNWADQANSYRILTTSVDIAIALACIAAIAVALVLFWRFGREHKPDFTGDYWRDVPEKGMHPAVMGRLWRWNHENADDFTATLMSLAHRGVLRIDRGSYVDGKGETIEDYYLTRIEPAASNVENAIDRATMRLLFDKVAEGEPSVWLGSIRKFGLQEPERYTELMGAWQGTLTAEVNKRDFFELRSKRLQTLVGVLAVVFAAVGIFMGLGMESFVPPIMMIPTAVLLVVIANYMPRRTVEGNNITARAKALRNWLRDFSTLDERPPTDVRVWGEFMVYAYLFGVANQAIRELRNAVPELFADETAEWGPTYVPWYCWWYMPHAHAAGAAGVPSVADAIDVAVSNTLANAQAAVSTMNVNMSGGGGMGGGFSFGGGSGFGGGGGAR